MQIPTLLLSILLLISPTLTAAKPPKNAILLSSVKTLTLRANAVTSHRRVAAMPQLTCKGPGCKHHTVEIMRCTNAGSEYESEDVQWSCVANVPEEFKLGSTDVICEGYASSEDSYVLKGSCGVEYRLLLTEKGEEKYGKSAWKDTEAVGGIGGVLFMACFIGILGWILYSMYMAYMNNNNPNAPRPARPLGWGGNGGWGGGGGGGGGNGWDDPPPPYSKPSGGQQGYRPGFWTGALGGAAAGYAAGSRGNRQNGRSSMFGGGNNNAGSSWGNNTTPSRPSPSSSSSSSSARHESTGFGSTTRR